MYNDVHKIKTHIEDYVMGVKITMHIDFFGGAKIIINHNNG